MSPELKEVGESFYNEMIKPAIEECQSKNLVENDQGAKIIRISGKQVPLMVQKSDGGFGYDSTDLACIKYRIEKLNSDRIIYITDSGQSEHFELLFQAAQLVGWSQTEKHQIEHMGFGVVLGEDGKKFKTRSGELVRLIELLDEAAMRAKKGLEDRIQEGEKHQTHLSQEMFEQASEILGVAAIKYFDLRQNRTSNYKFEFDKMLDPKGNTAIYLIYAYARICSILRKVEEQKTENLEKNGFKISSNYERSLASTLSRLPDVVQTASEDGFLHKITDLMYEIVVKFNEFYKNCVVLDNEHTQSRIKLCLATKNVLQKLFFLLTIPTIDRI